MQRHQVPIRNERETTPDADVRSEFHSAFSRARLESRSVDVGMIRSKDPEPGSPQGEPEFRAYEVRIAKRSGKRSADVARWNKLGQQGWVLISVVGRQAFFRRVVATGADRR